MFSRANIWQTSIWKSSIQPTKGEKSIRVVFWRHHMLPSWSPVYPAEMFSFNPSVSHHKKMLLAYKGVVRSCLYVFRLCFIFNVSSQCFLTSVSVWGSGASLLFISWLFRFESTVMTFFSSMAFPSSSWASLFFCSCTVWLCSGTSNLATQALVLLSRLQICHYLVIYPSIRIFWTTECDKITRWKCLWMIFRPVPLSLLPSAHWCGAVGPWAPCWTAWWPSAHFGAAQASSEASSHPGEDYLLPLSDSSSPPPALTPFSSGAGHGVLCSLVDLSVPSTVENWNTLFTEDHVTLS